MKDVMRRLLLTIFAIAFLMTMQVLVCIHGWGLVPKSWFWILGVSLISQVVGQLFVMLAKD